MALSNNTELKAAVADWLNRSDLTTQIVDFIRLAEVRIATNLKTADLQVTTTMTIDEASEDLPADFRGMIAMDLGGSYPPLDYLAPHDFHTRHASNTTGRPISYTIQANKIYFGPTPDGTYTGTYTYIAQPDIASDTTNRLLTIAPNLYLFGALAEAAIFLNDDLASMYEQKYQDALNLLQESEQYVGEPQFLSDVP